MRSPRLVRYVFLVTISLLVSYALLTWRFKVRTPRRFSIDEKGYGGREGHPYPNGAKSPNEQHAVAIIDEFRFAWHGYCTHCWGHDELLPVTGKCSNSRNGWGASIIDALSTALVMRQKDIVLDILDHIPEINFSRNGGWPKQVSVFETTIRYLAGLISAYDLLNTGLKDEFGVEQWQVDALLVQAKILADKLFIAFDTPTGIPVNWLWFEVNHHVLGQRENTLAAIGTLTLEFQRLSDLTEDPRYSQAVKRAMTYLLDPERAVGQPPYDGLFATWMSLETGAFTDQWGSWGAGRDSAYEYLIKAYVYDHRKFREYGDAWQAAAKSTVAHAAAYPTVREREAFLMDWGGQNMLMQADYLSAFAAGNFLLAGSVYGDSFYTEFGVDLVNGIHALQKATKTGLGPEKHCWNPKAVPPAKQEFYNQHGWFITDSRYQTRPEVLEAYYYAYRITGDTKYQDWTYELFQNILKACKTNYGYSSIDDVDAEEPKLLDFQDSFLFSEVMKYAYLTFAQDDEPWQVQKDGRNGFVFNTEGHPLRARCKMPDDLSHIGSCSDDIA